MNSIQTFKLKFLKKIHLQYDMVKTLVSGDR